MKLKPVRWVSSSKKDFLEFPKEVIDGVGYALYFAQRGELHEHCKVLKGFGGSGVIEIVERDKAGTFRVVYTVQISNFIFVLHAFQKKSKQGIKTPKQEIDLIKKRLKQMKEIYKELNYEKEI